MLRYLLLLFPAVLCGAGSLDWAIGFGPGRFDTQTTADRDGNLVQAQWGGDCSLPAVSAISSCGPVWVAKLDSAAGSIRFATYLGMTDPVGPEAGVILQTLKTDRDGNIYLLLSTSRAVLPAINAAQADVRGLGSVYLCKLAADGSRVIYATYLGGSGLDLPQTLAVDDLGRAWLLTLTASADFPETPGAPVSRALSRAAVTRFSAEGALEYSATLESGLIPPSLQIDSGGGALLMVNGEVLRVAPDSGQIQRTGLRAPPIAYSPLLLASPDGNVWLAGTVTNGLLPITANAAQPTSGPSAILRVVPGADPSPPSANVGAHQVREFAVDPADRARIFAATDAGLWLSEDNGDTWVEVDPRPAYSVAVDTFDSSVVYFGGDSALFRSTDRGRTFRVVSDPALAGSARIRSVATDAFIPGKVYAAGSALYHSEDGGEHWRPYFFPGQPGGTPSSNIFTTPAIVRVDPNAAGVVYVSATSQCLGFCPVIPSLYRSGDGGVTFSLAPITLVSGPAPDFAIAPSSGDLYVLNDAKLTAYRGGAFDRPETLEVSGASALALDPSGALYVSADGGVILRSEDDGATWTTPGRTPSPSQHIAISAGGTIQLAQPADATDGFLSRYDASGTLQYASYFGGGNTHVGAAAIGAGGHLFLAGSTGPGLPVRDAVQQEFGGGATDAFIAEFDANGTIVAATYLGGPGEDQIQSITAIDDGVVVVVGTTDGLPGLSPGPLGSGRAFAARVNLRSR